ncbi:AlpA family phage regulatory protein [Nostoc sp. CHAB 5824]|nr:AlpA family phage regulatory protein [Nostoc sp. CHAB 5824]
MMDNRKIQQRDSLLSLKEVKERIGVSSTTLWRWQSSGNFPARRQLSGNKIAWLESEVNEWIQTRPVVERPDPSLSEIPNSASCTVVPSETNALPK